MSRIESCFSLFILESPRLFTSRAHGSEKAWQQPDRLNLNPWRLIIRQQSWNHLVLQVHVGTMLKFDPCDFFEKGSINEDVSESQRLWTQMHSSKTWRSCFGRRVGESQAVRPLERWSSAKTQTRQVLVILRVRPFSRVSWHLDTEWRFGHLFVTADSG